MKTANRTGALDWFRPAAALLVAAIHTSVLSSVNGDADFILTRIAARIAVPFFFMVTGYFTLAGDRPLLPALKKTLLLYLASVLLYFPVNIYAGHFEGKGFRDILRMLVFDGTFYHLWYLPALCLGSGLVWLLRRKLPDWGVMAVCLVLYAAGLAGDSYYGLLAGAPALRRVYEAAFSVFSYTRNGIFFAPVFLAMGAWLRSRPVSGRKGGAAGFLLSLAAMTAEGMTLRRLELQRHDSMYIWLPVCMYFLFELLLSIDKKPVKALRSVSLWIYLIHPLMIVVVRGAADALHLTGLLVDNSLGHYAAVCILSVGFALAAVKTTDAAGRIPRPWRQAGRELSQHQAGKQGRREVSQNQAGKQGRRELPLHRTGKQGRRELPLHRTGKQGSRELPLHGTGKPARREAPLRQTEARDFRKGRAWIELSRENLAHNAAQLESLLQEGCRLMPVVKADAYGHGAELIAKELNALGIRSFCVASVTEGAKLRGAGVRGEILILGYTHPEQFPLLSRFRLTQTVIDYPYARLLNAYGGKIRVQVKIDTGMHRLGERSERFEEICGIFRCENLKIGGIYTHLCADETVSEEDSEFTHAQADAFYDVCARLDELGFDCSNKHLQASYGLLNYPGLCGSHARVGIALYGALSRPPEGEGGFLRPVLSLKARVASVKELYEGETAGYGMQFIAKKDMKIAAVSIGYADGFPRSMSCGNGEVLLHGRRAPVVGSVCMDQIIVDVTDIPETSQGDIAVVIGRDGEEEITACDLARRADTITNEILSRLGGRLERMLAP